MQINLSYSRKSLHKKFFLRQIKLCFPGILPKETDSILISPAIHIYRVFQNKVTEEKFR